MTTKNPNENIGNSATALRIRSLIKPIRKAVSTGFRYCFMYFSDNKTGNFFFALHGQEGHVPFTVVFFRARNSSVADSRNQPAAR